MKKIPISIIIDDSAPIISVYHEHHEPKFTDDGRPLLPVYPNSFLDVFCGIVEKHGIKGKFSVVPMPGNKGDILSGIEGHSEEELNEWLGTVKKRIVPNFTIGPEMLTHHKAVDIETGAALEMNEEQWAAQTDRTQITPYIAKALTLLNKAGFDAFGVTSPWTFGRAVEDEYTASVSKAVYDVTGKKKAWFFLRSLRDVPNAKPWIELEEEGRCLVSIPATTRDVMWDSIHTADCSDEYIRSRADLLITDEGKGGAIIRVLETGGYPILVTHWQSLISNGLGTGMKILDLVGERIKRLISDRVEWKSFEQIMDIVVENKRDYPKPQF
ncbi:MAG: hypothetical protein E7441_02820 [Ruminococcaceae bacterium]|nr:hypothetical protein [Oscillospiraceae bacterium]